jgi:hypothetical protein
MMKRWLNFQQCPSCSYDFGTGDGERSCAWGDCPYLPAELDVFCPDCRFSFASMEGNPMCEEPETCPNGAEARAHVENLREWERMHHRAGVHHEAG